MFSTPVRLLISFKDPIDFAPWSLAKVWSYKRAIIIQHGDSSSPLKGSQGLAHDAADGTAFPAWKITSVSQSMVPRPGPMENARCIDADPVNRLSSQSGPDRHVSRPGLRTPRHLPGVIDTKSPSCRYQGPHQHRSWMPYGSSGLSAGKG